jgi:hypothetical protein
MDRRVNRRQYFHYLGWHVDIDHANRLIASNPRETVGIDTARTAAAFGLDAAAKEHAGGVAAGLIAIDKAHAMSVDLSKPLILATIHGAAGHRSLLLIDGWHRVYKGAATHSHVLRAYALTFEEVMESSNIEAPVPAITGRNERQWPPQGVDKFGPGSVDISSASSPIGA